MQFDQLTLIGPLLRAVRSEGYITPTAIQEQAIPYVLEGRDVLGCAQTGTGKTAAFALPILQRLQRPEAASKSSRVGCAARRPIRALILSPTRELAAQIGESFRAYGKHAGLRHTVVFGGVKQGAQVHALQQGVDILVATPGRLLDLLNQRVLRLSEVEIFVLDEADRMLDMGFIDDIRRVIALLPSGRQTLLFSATMPREICRLAETILRDPVEVRVVGKSAAADTVEHAVYFVDSGSKPDLLDHVLKDPQITRALVFTRTKHRADQVVRGLRRSDIAAEAIHSNKSQNVRMRALGNFREGRTRVLVASDVAARGLDVDDISHVINYDLPNETKMYVHRIGRSGRAGALGLAISFCGYDQRKELRDIEQLIGKSIPVLDHSIKPSATRATGRSEPSRSALATGRSGPRPSAGPRRRRASNRRRRTAR